MGIFFDTYSNVQQGHQQYASVMVGDGNQVYDHDRDGGDAKIAGVPEATPGARTPGAGVPRCPPLSPRLSPTPQACMCAL